MNKKPKKWNENKALKAFKNFYISRITTIEQPEGIVDDEFRKRYGNPCDIEIELRCSTNNAVFTYSTPNLQYLDEYGLNLYLFLMGRPRRWGWKSSKKVYNGNTFIEKDIEYHEN